MRTRQILCPTDFSETASHALSYGIEMANLYGVSLRLVHVMSEPFSEYHYGVAMESAEQLDRQIKAAADENLDKLKAQILQDLNHGLTVQTVLRKGDTLDQILEESKVGDVGMIVIASHGHQGISHLLNPNIAETLANKAKCPVLVVK
ncbi:universal stress protein A [Shewanella sairae]|uniref:Universal stress protein A n=1 Tax=Shewanella sairae TaxID=190310 RepID=A0ABQ4PKP4_9GAMM|nr:universal stress protein [Shewanella sairae]MCL1131632.1 universal stress protein [Shewanella sairae]GIU48409.1 universal stress protein A [Shewanella sairae]